MCVWYYYHILGLKSGEGAGLVLDVTAKGGYHAHWLYGRGGPHNPLSQSLNVRSPVRPKVLFCHTWGGRKGGGGVVLHHHHLNLKSVPYLVIILWRRRGGSTSPPPPQPQKVGSLGRVIEGGWGGSSHNPLSQLLKVGSLTLL